MLVKQVLEDSTRVYHAIVMHLRTVEPTTKVTDSLFSICIWQYALFRTQVRTIRNCWAAIELFGTVGLQ